MRLKEQKVWDTMRSHCPSDVWLQRVENMIGVGMPDVSHIAQNGIAGWVELKAATSPVRSGTRLLGTEGLNIDQINWHLKYASMNGKSWILIRDNGNNLFMIPGKHAAAINNWTKEELRRHTVATSWAGVFNVLRGLNEN